MVGWKILVWELNSLRTASATAKRELEVVCGM